MTENDLIELVELLRDHRRDGRYRELMAAYDADEAIAKVVEKNEQDRAAESQVG